MKKIFSKSLVSFTTLVMLVGCDKELNRDKCLSYTTAQITTVGGPDNVSVNQEIDLNVSYFFNNGCGKFDGVESAASGNTTIISLKAKYEGCVCTAIIQTGEVNYKFKAGQAGVYYLKFLQPNNTYFTDTITVN